MLLGNLIIKQIERVDQAVAAMRKRFDVREVYLFGSQVRGTPHKWSDIDVGVFLAEFETAPFKERTQAIVDAQREFGDDLEFHFFDLSNPATQESVSFAAEVKRTGIKVG